MSKRYIIEAQVYDKKGRLIGKGRNSYSKTHPLMAYFGHRVGMPERVYLHAEVAALLKAGKQHVDRMEIKRINADGTYGMAAPCAICREALKAFNVRKVSHT